MTRGSSFCPLKSSLSFQSAPQDGHPPGESPGHYGGHLPQIFPEGRRPVQTQQHGTEGAPETGATRIHQQEKRRIDVSKNYEQLGFQQGQPGGFPGIRHLPCLHRHGVQ